jgi:hypothetical protein
MKVSLQLIPAQPVEELLEAAQVADELGYRHSCDREQVKLSQVGCSRPARRISASASSAGRTARSSGYGPFRNQ